MAWPTPMKVSFVGVPILGAFIVWLAWRYFGIEWKPEMEPMPKP